MPLVLHWNLVSVNAPHRKALAYFFCANNAGDARNVRYQVRNERNQLKKYSMQQTQETQLTELTQATQQPKRNDGSGVCSCVACVTLDGNQPPGCVDCMTMTMSIAPQWCTVRLLSFRLPLLLFLVRSRLINCAALLSMSIFAHTSCR